MKVNFSKFKILTNIKEIQDSSSLTLDINSSSYTIPVTAKNACERFLGVYINAYNDTRPSTKKLYSTVYAHLSLMKKKKISFLHCQYIINKVIIPKLEYISQLHFLSHAIITRLFSPIKKFYKHHLNLLTSTPDNIIHNPLFLEIQNCYHIQLKSQLANIIALGNCPHTQTIIK